MSVAKSYARALLEAAKAKGGQDLDAIENQLDLMAETMHQSKDLDAALVGPVVSAKEKVAVIQEFARRANLLPLVSQFLQLLARKGRIRFLDDIREQFSAARLASEGGIQGRIVSADPLKPEDIQQLAIAFGQKLGRKVAFRTQTDPSLLAGMRVTVSGTTYDGSLKSQLERLREKLVYGKLQQEN